MNDDDPSTEAQAGPFPSPEAVAQRRRLSELRTEHADLDASVNALAGEPVVDQIRLARLKKRKLALRDEIARLEDALTPDIIA